MKYRCKTFGILPSQLLVLTMDKRMCTGLWVVSGNFLIFPLAFKKSNYSSFCSVQFPFSFPCSSCWFFLIKSLDFLLQEKALHYFAKQGLISIMGRVWIYSTFRIFKGPYFSSIMALILRNTQVWVWRSPLPGVSCCSDQLQYLIFFEHLWISVHHLSGGNYYLTAAMWGRSY